MQKKVQNYELNLIRRNNHTNNQTKIIKTKSGLMKLSNYILALRPWSLSASLIPTLLGATLAYKHIEYQQFNILILLLTIITILSVHGAGNVVNTYFDYIKGIDNRKSDDRVLIDHLLTKDEIVTLATMLYVIGCFGFIGLVNLSTAKMEHLALIYFGGLSSSFLYTGGIGFKYIAFGDIIIILLFGPISVLFAFITQTGHLDWSIILYAIPLAMNTEAILHSNNTRDLDADRKVGIVTLAILIGHTGSHLLYAFLLFAPYVMFMVATMKYSILFLLPIITIPYAFRLEKQLRTTDCMDIPKKTAKLNLFFGILYVLTCNLLNDLPLIY